MAFLMTLSFAFVFRSHQVVWYYEADTFLRSQVAKWDKKKNGIEITLPRSFFLFVQKRKKIRDKKEEIKWPLILLLQIVYSRIIICGLLFLLMADIYF